MSQPGREHNANARGQHQARPQAMGFGRTGMMSRRPVAGFGGRRPGPKLGGTVILALIIAAVALFRYFGTSSTNPLTGKNERVSLTVDQEIQLGLQAAPQLVAQHRGPARGNPQGQQMVQSVGDRLLEAMLRVVAKDDPVYQFSFTLLDDDQVVNAFALPGGPIFITEALLNRLQTEGQLAGVLGHEIGHVLERHGAERIAKMELTQGLTSAAVIAMGDPNSSQLAQMIANVISMKYGRDDELESDRWGVDIMAEAGYDPRAMIGVMKILQEASGGQKPPEMLSTHPASETRIEAINQRVRERFADPKQIEGLKP